MRFQTVCVYDDDDDFSKKNDKGKKKNLDKYEGKGGCEQ